MRATGLGPDFAGSQRRLVARSLLMQLSSTMMAGLADRIYALDYWRLDRRCAEQPRLSPAISARG